MNFQPFPVCTCTCTCGAQQSQSDAQHKDNVFHFLMGLNDSYGNVKTQILLIEPLPSISKVYSLILQKEKRRQIGQGTEMVVEPTVLYVNNSNHGKRFHGNQGGKGGNSKKERPICTYCGIVGHIADKCYKLLGYPLGYKPKGKSSANQVSSEIFGNSMPSNGSSFGNFNSQLVPAKVAEMMNYSHQFNDSQGHFNGTQFPQTHYNGT